MSFDDLESAEKWIEQNKPVFSRKQVLDAIFNSTSGTNNMVCVKYHLKKELGL